MQIIVDENIPFADEFFSSLSNKPIIKAAGRNLLAGIDADVLAQVQAIVIRSVTRVDDALLANCPNLRFVGTCTIGVDHIDRAACARHGVHVESAPGCNANSVVEYVFSALAALDVDWQEQRFGIVGCGNVGGALFRRLHSLGVSCKVYDPLVTTETWAAEFHTPLKSALVTDLAEVLSCDVLCLHTPLTTSGPYPTRHLIGKNELDCLQPGSLLLNAGRGPVIDNAALLDFLRKRQDVSVVLDVWEPEPAISLPLLACVDIATPHIAGYSFDGKAMGTAMIYNALCKHMALESSVILEQVLPVYDGPEPVLSAAPMPISQQINSLVLQAYDVRADDRLMRQVLIDAVEQGGDIGRAFDQLRKHYPVRREFQCHSLSTVAIRSVAGGEALLQKLGIVGFSLSAE